MVIMKLHETRRKRSYDGSEGCHQEDKGWTIQGRVRHVRYPGGQVSARAAPSECNRGTKIYAFPQSSYFIIFIQLLDVFSSKTNLNLVLEFLDSDLEMIIKDRSLVFLPADIKSWMAMTFRGLEFCHRNWILHRVIHLWLLLP